MPPLFSAKKTAPTAAFKVGEKSSDPLAMYLSDIYTISCNLAGISGISIPCGFTDNGLPIGSLAQDDIFEPGKTLREVIVDAPPRHGLWWRAWARS